MQNPKAPKDVDPEPQSAAMEPADTNKSPPAKVQKVNEDGSAPPPEQMPTTSDHENSAAASDPSPHPPLPTAHPSGSHLQESQSSEGDNMLVFRFGSQSRRQVVEPCSMACGLDVPSLSCTACLCLYHPTCAGHRPTSPPETFLCKNCRKPNSPPLELPFLTYQAGVLGASLPVPVPILVPVLPVTRHFSCVSIPVYATGQIDDRLTLRRRSLHRICNGRRACVRCGRQARPEPSSSPLQPSQQEPAQAEEPVQVSQPVIPAPVIPAPEIPAPVIPAPVIPAPVIPEPVIPEPVIPEPVIPEPVIPEPVIPAPVIPAPVIPAPVIPAPVIPAPVIPAPMNPAPMNPPPMIPPPVIPPQAVQPLEVVRDPRALLPQSLAVVNGKLFIVVPRPK